MNSRGGVLRQLETDFLKLSPNFRCLTTLGLAIAAWGAGERLVCHHATYMLPYVCFLYHPPKIAYNFAQPSEGVRSRFKVLYYAPDYGG